MICLGTGGRNITAISKPCRAHTHSYYDENVEHDYWAEPHSSANQDFTRIVFTSNWGRTGTDAVDMYMISLPEAWVSRLP